MRSIYLFILLFPAWSIAQPAWTFFSDSVVNLSSPRPADLNNDGVKDIVYGCGTDGFASVNGIIAVNGADGSLLWRRPARNEVFGSPVFKDITGDGIVDVFITGRQAQLLAINGANGQLIWDYFPYAVNPADSGLYNFFNPQFIPDANNDGVEDILVANGGDHAAPIWDTLRPPGHLMVISSTDGSRITQAVVPDSAETYCSALVVDLLNNGTLWVLYGTGGESLPGKFYACELNALLAGSLASSMVLASHPTLGFIAPASVSIESNGAKKIFLQAYGGTIYCIDPVGFNTLWTYTIPGTESSSQLTLGNFTGDHAIDAFAVLYKGTAPAFTDYYQVMLDGSNGVPAFRDSIGTLHFASASAFDYNNDGRDEIVAALDVMSNGYFKNHHVLIDFQQDTILDLVPPVSGTNIASTPLIHDLDADGDLEFVYLTRKDSLNPSAWKGVFARRYDLNATIPNAGIAWGSYMGTFYDGEYFYAPHNCGPASVSPGAITLNPSCNGLADGTITPLVNAGNGPHTWLWNTGQVDSTLTNLPAGTYEVRITNAQNCFEDLTITLNDPYVITFGGIVPPTCPSDTNGMATLNSSGCQCMFSTCTFLWWNGITTHQDTALHAGWNAVTINHPGGCVVVDSVFVPESPAILDSIYVTHVACYGDSSGSIMLDENDLFAPLTITWSDGSQNYTLDNLSAGTYLAQITDSRGCADSVEVVVDQNPLLQVNANVGNVSCFGSGDGFIDVQFSGGLAPYFIMMDSLILSTPVTNLPAGNFTIVPMDAAGCFTDSLTINISEPTVISALYDVVPEATPNTNSGIATAHASGGTPPYSYIWNDPNTQSDSMAVYLNTGWYTVQITDANGCSFSDSVYVGFLTGLDESYSNEIEIYPNPVVDRLFFNQQVDLVEVLTLNGRILIVKSHIRKLDLADLPVGVYLINLVFENNSEVFKLIKH